MDQGILSRVQEATQNPCRTISECADSLGEAVAILDRVDSSDPYTEVYQPTLKEGQKNQRTWVIDLAHVVAHSTGCVVSQSGPQLLWKGQETKVLACEYLVDLYVDRVSKICDTNWQAVVYLNSLGKGPVAHGKSWKSNFCHNAVLAIAKKVDS